MKVLVKETETKKQDSEEVAKDYENKLWILIPKLG